MKDYEIKLSNQKIVDLNFYINEETKKLIYALEKKDSTLFFDENFNIITTAPKKINSHLEVADFLLENMNLKIQNQANKVGGDFEPDFDYPYIDIKEESNQNEYLVFCFYYSENEYKPLFKIKKQNNKLIEIDRKQNIINSFTKNNNSKKLNFSFHVDVKQNKVLFPEKYWKLIGLELINTNNTETAN